MGVDRIAQLSKVSTGTVRRLLAAPVKSPAPLRIRSETARRLLALSGATTNISPSSLVAVDATGQRLNELTAAGYSLTALARTIGKPAPSLRRSLSRRFVTVQTAKSVEALYKVIMKSNAQRQEHRGSA